MKKNFLIIDCFGKDRGHHVNYNQFLIDALCVHVNLSICCSKKLAGVLTGKVTKLTTVCHIAQYPSLLRLGIAISLLFLRVQRYDSIFCSAFEEVSFCLWRRSTMRKVSILVTNNLEHLKRNGLKFILLRRIFRHVNKILVHSNYQKDFIISCFGISEEKIFTIPHYAAGYDRSVNPQDVSNREEIVYLGGSRGDKGLTHFVNLINADETGKNKYGIYGDVNLTPKQVEQLAAKNVNVVQKYLSKEEYFHVLRRSKFVVLFYDRSFETRISGIFFDAISCFTPVLASNIKSFTAYFERFGKLGMIVDLSNAKWTEELLLKGFSSEYDVYLATVQKMQKECSHTILTQIYLSL